VNNVISERGLPFAVLERGLPARNIETRAFDPHKKNTSPHSITANGEVKKIFMIEIKKL